jgi:hypothetical protein
MKEITFSPIAKQELKIALRKPNTLIELHSIEQLTYLVTNAIRLTKIIIDSLKEKNGLMAMIPLVPSIISFAQNINTKFTDIDNEIRDLSPLEISQLVQITLGEINANFELIARKTNYGIENIKEVLNFALSLFFNIQENKNVSNLDYKRIIDALYFIAEKRKEIYAEASDLDIFEGLQLVSSVIKSIEVYQKKYV